MGQALGLAKGGVLVLELLQSRIEPAIAKKASHRGGYRILPAALAPNTAMRHRGLDAKPQALETVRQLGGRQRTAHRHHATADVHADGGRYDGASAGDHRAD